MDWLDQTRRGRMRAYMVSPTNLNLVIGELECVDWASSKISADYYSTTRTSASLVVVGGNWQRNTFIRLVYEIPEWEYIREMGTYLVSNDNSTRKNNVWTTTLELHSMIYALDAEIAPESKLVQTDTSALTTMKSELDAARREHSFVSPNDYRFTTPTLFEGGNSRLSRLNELCKTSNNRVDVDGHGRVIISKYQPPASKAPSINLSLTDKRGIVSDSVGRSSNLLEMPNQAVVSYRFSVTDDDGNTRDEEIVAIVEASPNSPTGSRTRGYNITHYENVNDMTPATYERAQQLAQENLAKNSRELIEWTITTKYIPVWEGDVITLEIPDGLSEYRGRRHCLVKGVDMSGPFWDMKLTLKETASGDDE